MLSSPQRPLGDVSAAAMETYATERRQYINQVEEIASEVEQLCRELHGLSDAIEVPPMFVMESVSSAIWQGDAAFRFNTAGNDQKRSCARVAEDIRTASTAAMRTVNSYLSSL